MPMHRRRSFPLEAWQWFPGVKLEGLEERSFLHAHFSSTPRILAVITRHGKEYPVSPGDYVYKDDAGNWDACPKNLFESQWEAIEPQGEGVRGE